MCKTKLHRYNRNDFFLYDADKKIYKFDRSWEIRVNTILQNLYKSANATNVNFLILTRRNLIARFRFLSPRHISLAKLKLVNRKVSN